MPVPPVSIIKIKPVDRGTNLKAFVDICIAGKVNIFGCRVIQQPNQKPWVAMPQTESPAKNAGEKSKWFPIVEISDEKLRNQISDAVLTAWREL